MRFIEVVFYTYILRVDCGSDYCDFTTSCHLHGLDKDTSAAQEAWPPRWILLDLSFLSSIKCVAHLIPILLPFDLRERIAHFHVLHRLGKDSVSAAHVAT